MFAKKFSLVSLFIKDLVFIKVTYRNMNQDNDIKEPGPTPVGALMDNSGIILFLLPNFYGPCFTK
jgi:hypothetical protein